MMKVSDYVLTEKYVQQYVGECIFKPDIDLDRDHCILMTSLYTPITHKAHRKDQN